MTHPPGGPSTPAPPGGPHRTEVTPIDPDSPAGREAADALSQALAEVYAGIAARRAAATIELRGAA